MYVALPLPPSGWLDFSAAGVMLVLFAAVLCLWVGWLHGRWTITP